MKNYLLIHFIFSLIPALIMIYLYHFVVRGQQGIAFLYLSVIIVFFLSIITGIAGAKYSNSIWIPAAINCGVVLIATVLSGQWSVSVAILPVAGITFLCSFFTWLIMNEPSGSFLRKTYTGLFILLLLAGIYLFFAFVNGPVHRGDSSLFFRTDETSVSHEQVMPSREQYETYVQYAGKISMEDEIDRRFGSVYASTVLMNEDGVPYSGKLYLQKPKLRINPFPAQKEVLLYYIDGFLWGYSYGETHLPTYYTDKALLHLPGMPASVPFLIYKKYEEQALQTLSLVGEYIVLPDNRILAIGEDNSLYLGDIAYHYNGLLQYIHWKRFDMNIGMDWFHYESRYFDTLGYSEDRSGWDASDFIETDTLPELVKRGVMKDPEGVKCLEEAFVHSTRIWLPENHYVWNTREGLLFNLCGLHGFGEEKKDPVDIEIADPRDRTVRAMDPEDIQQIASIINQCIIEPQLDNPGKRHIWYDKSSVFFLIQEDSTGKSFPLGYDNGRFVMRNNLYTFVFPEEKAEELTGQMLGYIQKYTEGDPD